jgi:hypothetical protein
MFTPAKRSSLLRPSVSYFPKNVLYYRTQFVQPVGLLQFLRELPGVDVIIFLFVTDSDAK